jgi:hypothetical protein
LNVGNCGAYAFGRMKIKKIKKLAASETSQLKVVCNENNSKVV